MTPDELKITPFEIKMLFIGLSLTLYACTAALVFAIYRATNAITESIKRHGK